MLLRTSSPSLPENTVKPDRVNALRAMRVPGIDHDADFGHCAHMVSKVESGSRRTMLSPIFDIVSSFLSVLPE